MGSAHAQAPGPQQLAFPADLAISAYLSRTAACTFKASISSPHTVYAFANIMSLQQLIYICQDVYMNSQISELETIFKALADATRLRIIGLLLAGEVCVCDIHESLRISQPKASRHLAYLRRSGLVDVRREGLWMHYRLADLSDPILRTIQQAVTHALRHVGTLQKDVERLQRKTGCCLPPPIEMPTLACCSGPDALVPIQGARGKRGR